VDLLEIIKDNYMKICMVFEIILDLKVILRLISPVLTLIKSISLG